MLVAGQEMQSKHLDETLFSSCNCPLHDENTCSLFSFFLHLRLFPPYHSILILLLLGRHQICLQLRWQSPPAMQDNRVRPWVRKIPWRRKWQPTPIFLSGKFHGQRSLAATVHGIKESQTRLSEHTSPQFPCKRHLDPSTLSESKSPSSSQHCLFQSSKNTKRASTRSEGMPDIVDTPENKSTCPQMASVQ